MSTHHTSGILWVSVISVAVGVILAIITVGVFSGKLDARVTALEQGVSQTVPRGEWNMFEKDMRERLDRIEIKLDRHMSRGEH